MLLLVVSDVCMRALPSVRPDHAGLLAQQIDSIRTHMRGPLHILFSQTHAEDYQQNLLASKVLYLVSGAEPARD